MKTVLRCPKCGSSDGACPECGKKFEHGTADGCDAPACLKMNAPVDCRCGLVVSANKDGVLSLEGDLIPWKMKTR